MSGTVIRRLTTDTWHQTSDIRRLTTAVWNQTSQNQHLKSDNWNQASDITRLKSDTWHQTSDIRHLKSDVYNLHLIQTFKIKRLMTDFWYQTSDVWFQMSVIRCLLSIVWYQTSDNMCLISDVWCQISVIRRHRFSGTNKPEKLWGVSKMWGQDRGLSRCFSLTCVSGKTHNLEAVSWKSYLVHKDDSCGPRRS